MSGLGWGFGVALAYLRSDWRCTPRVQLRHTHMAALLLASASIMCLVV